MNNATTGEQEWTRENVIGHTWQEIVSTHNAALAAEREKYVEQREDWIREIQQLREQLAAACARCGELVKICHKHEIYVDTKIDTTALDAAIAAARQPLVDGLHRLYALRDPTCQAQAERAYEMALAKVKGNQ